MAREHRHRRNGTASQVSIAMMYFIPLHMAHTISAKKCDAYFAYLSSSEARLENWLDKQEDRRRYERGEIYYGA